ncbi:MAG: ABC transporter substrate-binding protein [Deltaproteobacteria bacterium]
MKYTKKVLGWTLLAGILLWGSAGLAQDILIGYSGPMSGVAAEYGQDVYNGIALAVKEINAAGGMKIGDKNCAFKLERLDDRADPTLAVNNARRFRSSGAIAVFNPIFSTAAGIMKINEEKGAEFMVVAFTSTPRVEELKNKLTVTAPGPFTSSVEIYSSWAMGRGYKKCAMVVTLGAYGDEWRQVFRQVWEKKGGIITADRPANYYMETDFSSQLTAALATQPDVLLIGGPTGATALVIEQARGMGYKGGFIMIDQPRQDQIARLLGGTKMLGNTIGSAAADSMPPRPGQNFIERYRAEYRKAGAVESAVNYTLVYVLSKAIVAAGTPGDVYKIRAAFPKALPLLADKFPMEIKGISDAGRFHIYSSTQTITNGKWDDPIVYAWWPRTEEEFDEVVRSSQLDRRITKKWLRPAK